MVCLLHWAIVGNESHAFCSWEVYIILIIKFLNLKTSFWFYFAVRLGKPSITWSGSIPWRSGAPYRAVCTWISWSRGTAGDRWARPSSTWGRSMTCSLIRWVYRAARNKVLKTVTIHIFYMKAFIWKKKKILTQNHNHLKGKWKRQLMLWNFEISFGM